MFCSSVNDSRPSDQARQGENAPRRAWAARLRIAPRTVATNVLLVAALLVTAGTAATAQQGVGAKYAARDPRTCPDATKPVNGPPSPAQAALYLQCHIESEQSGMLYLISNVRVQVGKGTPFRELPGSERPFNGDVDGQVYAIRGSFKRYQCAQLSSGNPAGKNCNMYDDSRATGTCFHDKFGEWVCNMTDLSSRPVPNQPAPRS